MKMKNTAQEAAALREENRHRQKAQKHGVGLQPSKVATREKRKKILIVCEGRNTEPSYFRQFRCATADIEVMGEGFNTISLVNKAEEYCIKHERNKKERYDEVWCVFDKDSFDTFDAAIKLAKKKGYHVAFSNQAFEYWLILHFENHQGGGLHRDAYHAHINRHLHPFGAHYDGKGRKIVTHQIFDILLAKDPKTGKSRQEIAISRAEALHKWHEARSLSPSAWESCTTVYALVRRLNGL